MGFKRRDMPPYAPLENQPSVHWGIAEGPLSREGLERAKPGSKVVSLSHGSALTVVFSFDTDASSGIWEHYPSHDYTTTLTIPSDPTVAITICDQATSDCTTSTPSYDADRDEYSIPIPYPISQGWIDCTLTVQDCTVVSQNVYNEPDVTETVGEVSHSLSLYAHVDTFPLSHVSLFDLPTSMCPESSVSICGNVAAIGCPFQYESDGVTRDTSYPGVVYLFARQSDVSPWGLAASSTSTTPDALYGTSLSLYADSNDTVELAVTAPWDYDDVYFVRWSVVGDSLTFLSQQELYVGLRLPAVRTEAYKTDTRGYMKPLPVARSESFFVVADRNKLHDVDQYGVAHSFRKDLDTGVWSYHMRVDTDTKTGVIFGADIDISSGEVFLAVSTYLTAERDDKEKASAYVFMLDDHIEWKEVAELSVDGYGPEGRRVINGGTSYRHSVAMAGNTIVIGAPDIDHYSYWWGLVTVLYTDEEGNLVYQGQIEASQTTSFGFDVSLASSADGTSLLAVADPIYGPIHQNDPSVRIYRVDSVVGEVEASGIEVKMGSVCPAFDGQTVVDGGAHVMSQWTSLETGPSYLRPLSRTNVVASPSSANIHCEMYDDLHDSTTGDVSLVYTTPTCITTLKEVSDLMVLDHSFSLDASIDDVLSFEVVPGGHSWESHSLDMLSVTDTEHYLPVSLKVDIVDEADLPTLHYIEDFHTVYEHSTELCFSVTDAGHTPVPNLGGMGLSVDGGDAVTAVYDGDKQCYSVTLASPPSQGEISVSVDVPVGEYQSATLETNVYVYGHITTVSVSGIPDDVTTGEVMDVEVSLLDIGGILLYPEVGYMCTVYVTTDPDVEAVNGGEGTTVEAVWDAGQSLYTTSVISTSTEAVAVEVYVECVYEVDSQTHTDTKETSYSINVTQAPPEVASCYVAPTSSGALLGMTEGSYVVTAGAGFEIYTHLADVNGNRMSDAALDVSVAGVTLVAVYNQPSDTFRCVGDPADYTTAGTLSVSATVGPTVIDEFDIVILPEYTPSDPDCVVSINRGGDVTAGVSASASVTFKDRFGNTIEYDSVVGGFDGSADSMSGGSGTYTGSLPTPTLSGSYSLDLVGTIDGTSFTVTRTFSVLAGPAVSWEVLSPSAFAATETTTLTSTVADVYDNIPLCGVGSLEVSFTEDPSSAADCTCSDDTYTCDVTHDTGCAAVSEEQSIYAWLDGVSLGHVSVTVEVHVVEVIPSAELYVGASELQFVLLDSYGSEVPSLSPLLVTIDSNPVEYLYNDGLQCYVAELPSGLSLGDNSLSVSIFDTSYPLDIVSGGVSVYGALDVVIPASSSYSTTAGDSLSLSVTLTDVNGVPIPHSDVYQCIVTITTDVGVAEINAGDGTEFDAVAQAESGVFSADVVSVSSSATEISYLAECSMGDGSVDSVSGTVSLQVSAAPASEEDSTIYAESDSHATPENGILHITAGEGFGVSFLPYDEYGNSAPVEFDDLSITLMGTDSVVVPFDTIQMLFLPTVGAAYSVSCDGDILTQSDTLIVEMTISDNPGFSLSLTVEVHAGLSPSDAESVLVVGDDSPVVVGEGFTVSATFKDVYSNVIEYDSVTCHLYTDETDPWTLSLGTDGVYSGTITAPTVPGDVDVIVVGHVGDATYSLTDTISVVHGEVSDYVLLETSVDADTTTTMHVTTVDPYGNEIPPDGVNLLCISLNDTDFPSWSFCTETDTAFECEVTHDIAPEPSATVHIFYGGMSIGSSTVDVIVHLDQVVVDTMFSMAYTLPFSILDQYGVDVGDIGTVSVSFDGGASAPATFDQDEAWYTVDAPVGLSALGPHSMDVSVSESSYPTVTLSQSFSVHGQLDTIIVGDLTLPVTAGALVLVTVSLEDSIGTALSGTDAVYQCEVSVETDVGVSSQTSVDADWDSAEECFSAFVTSTSTLSTELLVTAECVVSECGHTDTLTLSVPVTVVPADVDIESCVVSVSADGVTVGDAVDSVDLTAGSMLSVSVTLLDMYLNPVTAMESVVVETLTGGASDSLDVSFDSGTYAYSAETSWTSVQTIDVSVSCVSGVLRQLTVTVTPDVTGSINSVVTVNGGVSAVVVGSSVDVTTEYTDQFGNVIEFDSVTCGFNSVAAATHGLSFTAGSYEGSLIAPTLAGDVDVFVVGTAGDFVHSDSTLLTLEAGLPNNWSLIHPSYLKASSVTTVTLSVSDVYVNTLTSPGVLTLAIGGDDTAPHIATSHDTSECVNSGELYSCDVDCDLDPAPVAYLYVWCDSVFIGVQPVSVVLHLDSVSFLPQYTGADSVRFHVLDDYGVSVVDLSPVTMTYEGVTVDATFDSDQQWYTATSPSTSGPGVHSLSVSVTDPDYPDLTVSAPILEYGPVSTITTSGIPTSVVAGDVMSVEVYLLDSEGVVLPVDEAYVCTVTITTDVGGLLDGGTGTEYAAAYNDTLNVYTATASSLSCDAADVRIAAQCVSGDLAPDVVSQSVPLTVESGTVDLASTTVLFESGGESLYISTGTMTAGAGLLVSVLPHDEYGNTLSASSVTIEVLSATGDLLLQSSAVEAADQSYTAEVDPLTLAETGAYDVSVTVDGVSIDVITLSVVSEYVPSVVLSTLSLGGGASNVTAGSSVVVLATFVDRFGNTVEYTDVDCAFSGDESVAMTLLGTEYTGTVIAPTVAGDTTLNVTGYYGGSSYSLDMELSVDACRATHIHTLGSTGIIAAGMTTMSVEVHDQFDNTVSCDSTLLLASLGDTMGSATECVKSGSSYTCEVSHDVDPTTEALLHAWLGGVYIGSVTESVIVNLDGVVSLPKLSTSSAVRFTIHDVYGVSVHDLINVYVTYEGVIVDATFNSQEGYYTVQISTVSGESPYSMDVSVSDPSYPSVDLTASVTEYGPLAGIASSDDALTATAGEVFDLSLTLLDSNGTTLPVDTEYTCTVTVASDVGIASINGGLGSVYSATLTGSGHMYTSSVSSVSTESDCLLVTAECVIGDITDSVTLSVPLTVQPSHVDDLTSGYSVTSGGVELVTGIDSSYTVTAGSGGVVSVTVCDEYGNPVSDCVVSISSDPGTGVPVLLGSKSSRASGVVFSLDPADYTQAETHNVSVIAGDLLIGSFMLKVVADMTPSDGESIVSVNGGEALVAGSVVVVNTQIRDMFGNSIVYDSVTCEVEGVVGSTILVSDGDGYVSGTVSLPLTVGDATLDLVGISGSDSYTLASTLEIQPGPAAHVVLTPYSIWSGLLSTVNVVLTDINGNPVAVGTTLSSSLTDDADTASECAWLDTQYQCSMTTVSEPGSAVDMFLWHEGTALGGHTLDVMGSIDSVIVYPVFESDVTMNLALSDAYGDSMSLEFISVSVDSGDVVSVSYGAASSCYSLPLTETLSAGPHTLDVSVSQDGYSDGVVSESFTVFGGLAGIECDDSALTTEAGLEITILVSLVDATGSVLPSDSSYQCTVQSTVISSDTTVSYNSINWEEDNDVYSATMTQYSVDDTSVMVVAECATESQRFTDVVYQAMELTVTPAAADPSESVICLEYPDGTSHCSLDDTSHPVTAGQAFSVTSQILDTYANYMTSEYADVSLIVSGLETVALDAVHDVDSQSYTVDIPGEDYVIAQALEISVMVGDITIRVFNMDVVPEAAASLTMSSISINGGLDVSVASGVSVAVTPRDSYGNTIPYDSLFAGFLKESLVNTDLSFDDGTYTGTLTAPRIAGDIPLFVHCTMDDETFSLDTTVSIQAGDVSSFKIQSPKHLLGSDFNTISVSIVDAYGNPRLGDTGTLTVSYTDDEFLAIPCTTGSDTYTCLLPAPPSSGSRVASVYAWYNSNPLGSYSMRVVGGTPDSDYSMVSPSSAVAGSAVQVHVSLYSSGGIKVLNAYQDHEVTLRWAAEDEYSEATYSPTSQDWVSTLTAPHISGTQSLHVYLNGVLFLTHTVDVESMAADATTSSVSPSIAPTDNAQTYTISLRNALGSSIRSTSTVVSAGWEDGTQSIAVLDTQSGSYSVSIHAADTIGPSELEVYCDGTLLMTHTVVSFSPVLSFESEAVTEITEDAEYGYGHAVAVSDNWKAVSAPTDGLLDQGRVYFYPMGTSDVSLSQVVRANDTSDTGLFGYALCLSETEYGSGIAYIGHPGMEAVEVFQESDGVWNYTGTVVAPDGMEGDGFGSSVACTDTTLVVGAPGAYSSLVPESGAAYVYSCDDGVCENTERLQATVPTTYAHLGTRVAISGDVAALTTSGVSVNETLLYEYDAELSQWEHAASLPYGGGDIALSDRVLAIASTEFVTGFGVFSSETEWGAMDYVSEDSVDESSPSLDYSTKSVSAATTTLSLAGGTLVVASSDSSHVSGSVTVYTLDGSSGVFVGTAPILSPTRAPASVSLDNNGNLVVGSYSTGGFGVSEFNLGSPAALVFDGAQGAYVQGTPNVELSYHFMDTLGGSVPLTDGVSLTVGDTLVNGVKDGSLVRYTSTVDIPVTVGPNSIVAKPASDADLLVGGMLVTVGPASPDTSEVLTETAVAGTATPLSAVLKSAYGDVNDIPQDVSIAWTNEDGTVTSVASIDSDTGEYTAVLSGGTRAGLASVVVSVGDDPVFMTKSISIVPDSPHPASSSVTLPETVSSDATVPFDTHVIDQWGNVCDGRSVTVMMNSMEQAEAVWNEETQSYVAMVTLPTEGETDFQVLVDGEALLSVNVSVDGYPLEAYIAVGMLGFGLLGLSAAYVFSKCSRKDTKLEILDFEPDVTIMSVAQPRHAFNTDPRNQGLGGGFTFGYELRTAS
ncbi:hypothetical protein KIPB_000082 [Kipferlia bialata]|uniref:Uncharacterized protein n=1 Tax=Kipferlia bialata TaxID=797122 RepID=A0A9K3GE84_9EUKA|nr:hypothetical protein KIPB_000082 [Kipferlia bialata]|eukprot:g82.t1